MIQKENRRNVSIGENQISTNGLPRIDSAVMDVTNVDENSSSSCLKSSPDTVLLLQEPKRRKVSLDNDEKKTSAEQVEISKTSTTTPALNVTPTTNSPFLNENYSNLASQSAGAQILFATDEWFAAADNLIQDGPPIFVPDLYCAQGKVMDGWESRRRREAGHDWCVIKLGTGEKGNRGDIHGIEVDTAHFTGNQAPRISIQVTNCEEVSSHDDEHDDDEESMYTWMPGAVTRLAKGGGIQGVGQSVKHVTRAENACRKFQWTEILPMTPLQPGYEETRMHYFVLSEEMKKKAKNATHVRVNYYPDGGVARLRLWGYPSLTNSSKGSSMDERKCPPSAEPYEHPELSLDTNGGCGLTCSNKHYGVPSNLIRATYGKDMGDGWETARHPDRPAILVKDPVTNLVDSLLMDWAILKLGMGGASDDATKGGVSRIIIDTKHFKGNYPESVQIEGCNAVDVSDDDVCNASSWNDSSSVKWFPLLGRTRLGPDREHVFTQQSGQLVSGQKGVTHVRVSIYPDGGLSRVRIYGQPANQNKC